MSSKILKIVGGVAILYIIGTQVSGRITANLRYGFKSLRFVDFWQNIKKFRVVLETVLTIENLNPELLEVKSFSGYLTFKGEELIQLLQDIPVVLKPKTRQPIKFRMDTDLIGAAAKLYIAITDDKKRIEGCRLKGDLSVKYQSIPFSFPYDEAVTIDL